MAPRVLISDALSAAALQIFRDRGIDVDFRPELGKDKDGLAAIIGDYDGLAIRSATKVTGTLLERAHRLKVIGRAGIGVDNVDIPAATARGGLVDEKALAAALDSGHVAGAAFDVFVEEPATSNVLFNRANVVCTPHLGASTAEAQENVALQVAEQMSDYLTRGAISNAINFPSITAEEAPKLKPFIALAEKLGSFAGQLTESGLTKVTITYEGAVAELKTRALTAAALAGLLRPALAEVNVVSAPAVARERGIVVEEVTRAAEGDYESLMTVLVTTERQTRTVAGTVFHDGKPRIVDIEGLKIDAEFGASMIYVSNEDRPGFIGRFAGLLGDAGVNIATFALGRDAPGGSALALVQVDGDVPAALLEQVRALPGVRKARALRF